MHLESLYWNSVLSVKLPGFLKCNSSLFGLFSSLHFFFTNILGIWFISCILQVRTLFVSGLPTDIKPRELYLLFRPFKVKTDVLNGKSHRPYVLAPNRCGHPSNSKTFSQCSLKQWLNWRGIIKFINWVLEFKNWSNVWQQRCSVAQVSSAVKCILCKCLYLTELASYGQCSRNFFLFKHCC